jgi:pimeloyl-ACP methyl ester carboxylesterase
VLFIHGFLGSGADASFLESLADITVIAPDLPGHGKSAPFSEASQASTSHFPELLADALSQYGPYELIVGYSLGGRIAREWLQRGSFSFTKWLFLSTFFGHISSGEARMRLKDDQRKAIDVLINPQDFLDRWNQQELFKPYSSPPSGSPDIDPQSASFLLEHFSAGHQLRLEEIPAGNRIGILFGQNDPKFIAHSRAMQLILEPALYREVPDAWHRIIHDQPGFCRTAVQDMLLL